MREAMGIALMTVDLLTRLPLRVEIRCVLVSADVVCVELPLHVEFVEEEAKFSAVGVIQELSVEGQEGMQSEMLHVRLCIESTSIAARSVRKLPNEDLLENMRILPRNLRKRSVFFEALR